ncbi:helix-turn-helix domain-containing protein [Paenibacillus sp. CMAA1364]
MMLYNVLNDDVMSDNLMSQIHNGEHKSIFKKMTFNRMLSAKLGGGYFAPLLENSVEVISNSQTSTVASIPFDQNEAIVSSILHQLSVSDTTNLMNDDHLEDLRHGFAIVREHLGEKNQEVALIRLSDSIQFEHIHLMIIKTIKMVTSKDRNGIICYVCRSDDRHYAMFFTFPEQCSIMTIRRMTDTILTDVKIKLKMLLDLHISIGVSDVTDGIQLWNRLFRQAERLAVLSYYNGYDRVFYPEVEGYSNIHEMDWKGKWKHARIELLESLNDSDALLWKEQYYQCCELLIRRYPSSPNMVRFEFSNVIWEVSSLIYQKGLSWEGLQEGIPHTISQINSLETWDETNKWGELFLQNLHVRLHPELKNTSSWLSPIVAKTKRILEKQFNESIYLSSISDDLGVSESYLSKQFSKEIGINFIKYLTNLRIEKAKEHLGNGLKIYEVAEQVGYDNPEHFSRVFKKATGISPLAYRQESK